MMTDQLISFETAKLAKEKGFWNVFTLYNKDGEIWNTYLLGEVEFNNDYPAPTQSLLQKWLREVHHIHLFVESIIYKDNINVTFYEYTLTSDLIKEDFEDDVVFNTYEEALEAGLIEALKLIK